MKNKEARKKRFQYSKFVIMGITSARFLLNITTAWFERYGESFSTLFSQQFQYQYEGISFPYSPIETKKGIVPNGVDRISVVRKAENINKTFNIPVNQRKEYSLTFGINYENLIAGKNHYILNFRKDRQLIKVQQFQINVSYKKIPLESTKKVHILINGHQTGNNNTPLLIQDHNQYEIIEAPYIFDSKVPYLIQPQKIQKDKKNGITYADIYFNGDVLVSKFPYEVEDAQSGNQATFSYNEKTQQLMVSRETKGACHYTQGAKGISTKTKEIFLDLSITKNQQNIQDGILITYKNARKLELFPEVQKNKQGDIYGLKYRYSVFQKNQRKKILEDYIVKNQKIIPTTGEASSCDIETFDYRFDPETMQLFIKRDENVGGKAETYRRDIERIPSFYRIRH